MAQEFGGRPQDRILDAEGDTITRITVEFYPTESDLQFKTNSRGTAFVPANGLWTFTDPGLPELWIAPVGGPYFDPYQVRSKTYLGSTFTPANPTLSVSYNPDGTVSSTTEDGVTTTFTYNTDGTVATQTRAGVTKTFTYSNGNVTGAA